MNNSQFYHLHRCLFKPWRENIKGKRLSRFSYVTGERGLGKTGSQEGKVTIPFLFTIMMLFRALQILFKDPKFRSLLYLTALTLITGTLFYHSVEGWSLLDAFYFSVITLATVGYGDFTPQTNLGKIFTVMYIFLGLGILVGFVTPIGEYLIDSRMKDVDKKMQEKENSKTESTNELDSSDVVGKLK